MPCEVDSQKISRKEDPLRHGAYKLVEEKAIPSWRMAQTKSTGKAGEAPAAMSDVTSSVNLDEETGVISRTF